MADSFLSCPHLEMYPPVSVPCLCQSKHHPYSWLHSLLPLLRSCSISQSLFALYCKTLLLLKSSLSISLKRKTERQLITNPITLKINCPNNNFLYSQLLKNVVYHHYLQQSCLFLYPLKPDFLQLFLDYSTNFNNHLNIYVAPRHKILST